MKKRRNSDDLKLCVEEGEAVNVSAKTHGWLLRVTRSCAGKN